MKHPFYFQVLVVLFYLISTSVPVKASCIDKYSQLVGERETRAGITFSVGAGLMISTFITVFISVPVTKGVGYAYYSLWAYSGVEYLAYLHGVNKLKVLDAAMKNSASLEFRQQRRREEFIDKVTALNPELTEQLIAERLHILDQEEKICHKNGRYYSMNSIARLVATSEPSSNLSGDLSGPPSSH